MSQLSICPTVTITLSDLRPIVADILDEPTGQWINIPPLEDTHFGNFTDETVRLELKNGHFLDEPDESTAQQVRELDDSCLINSTIQIGEVDISPTLTYVADIHFGDFDAKQQKFKARIINDSTLELVIPLSHIAIKKKIAYDGTVVLPDNSEVSVDEMSGVANHEWIGEEYEVALEFDIPPTKLS